MSEYLGIRKVYRQTADLPKVNNTLADTDLSVPVDVNQIVEGDITAYFTLAGAASGAAFELVPPAGGVDYKLSWHILDGATPANLINTQLAAAAFNASLANAANYTVKISFSYVNGTTAGVLKLQFAQKTTDAAAATLLKGSVMNVTVLA